jgi:hypothetical protein
MPLSLRSTAVSVAMAAPTSENESTCNRSNDKEKQELSRLIKTTKN